MTVEKTPPRSWSDAELLRHFAQSRSAEAFRQLVDRHIQTIHAAARRMLGDEHLAEDVTQSVFILLAQRAHRISPSTPLIGWLYKVTHFACANLNRKERNRRRLEAKAAAMEPAQTQTVHLSDAEVHLDAALQSLAAYERDAILLRFTSDLPVSEIARLTHVSMETAKKRLQRGLAKLRKYYSAQGLAEAPDLLEINSSAILALAPAHSAAALALAPAVTAASLAPLGLAAGTGAGIAASRLLAKEVARMMALTQAAKVTVTVVILALSWTTTGLILAQKMKSGYPAPMVLQHPVAGSAPAGQGTGPRVQRVIVGGVLVVPSGRPIRPGIIQTPEMISPEDSSDMPTLRRENNGTAATEPATQPKTHTTTVIVGG